MKRFFLIIGFLSIISFLFVLYQTYSNLHPKQNFSDTPPSPTPTTLAKSENLVSENEFEFAWVKVENPNKLTLYDNLSAKLKTEMILERISCRTLVSGGFYSKEGKPIGLFVSEGKKLSLWQDNRLFNAAFMIDSSGIPEIAARPNTKDLRTALQTGPLLIADGKSQVLSIKNDAGERRVVAALNNSREIYFLAFFKPSNFIAGPKLTELPQIVKEAGVKIGTDFVDAVNLDGGTASAFINESLKLRELTPIGSYFCINP